MSTASSSRVSSAPTLARGDILILGLTACAMPGDAERVLAAGCDGYLTKPIDVPTFLATVAGHLRP